MLQVPAVNRLATPPETLHTAGVEEMKLTGSHELAVALNVTEAAANWPAMPLNVSV